MVGLVVPGTGELVVELFSASSELIAEVTIDPVDSNSSGLLCGDPLREPFRLSGDRLRASSVSFIVKMMADDDDNDRDDREGDDDYGYHRHENARLR